MGQDSTWLRKPVWYCGKGRRQLAVAVTEVGVVVERTHIGEDRGVFRHELVRGGAVRLVQCFVDPSGFAGDGERIARESRQLLT